MNKRKHLPFTGVGPFYVFPTILISFTLTILSRIGYFPYFGFEFLSIPFIVIGVVFISFGILFIVLSIGKSHLFSHIENNQLVTTGIYSLTRNPIYTGFWFISIGLVLISNNLYLFILPVIYYIYLTILMIFSEEKWLLNLYGDEYLMYKKNTNRVIPFKRKKRY